MKYNKLLILFLIFCASLEASSQAMIVNAPIKARTNTGPVFVQWPNTGNQLNIGLWGQSNASGAGDTSVAPHKGVIPYAYIFNNNTRLLEPLRLGASANNTQNVGLPTTNATYGIEDELMLLLSNHYSNQTNYLYKYAYAGTCLAEGQQNGSWSTTPASSAPNVWNNCMNNHFQFIQQNPIRGPTLNWIIWIQGECDGQSGSTVFNAYQTNLTNLINNSRTYLHNSGVKWCLVSLSTNQTAVNSSGITAVNTAMSNVAGSLTDVYYISQNSSVGADNLHYNAAGISAIATLVYNVIIAH